jgi:hypothetical protein
MKTLLPALIAGAFALAHGPTLAQDKKPEPTKEEAKKGETKQTETKKAERVEAKKDDGKKKVKKGGC